MSLSLALHHPRVLYKANKANYDTYELSLRQHDYSAHPHFLQSDHKVRLLLPPPPSFSLLLPPLPPPSSSSPSF